jgi:hypothetical protein
MLAALSLAACSQSRGDPCQVKADCASGLVCCPAAIEARGLCVMADACPQTVIDAGFTDASQSNDDDAGNAQSM